MSGLLHPCLHKVEARGSPHGLAQGSLYSWVLFPAHTVQQQQTESRGLCEWDTLPLARLSGQTSLPVYEVYSSIPAWEKVSGT